MKLCTKQGNGVCCDCSDEYKKSVWCRNNIAEYANIMEEIIEDMTGFMYRNCGKFDSRKEVLEYFDFEFMDGRQL